MTSTDPTPSPEAIRDAADRLVEAARAGTPCAPVRDLIGATDVGAAYAVQGRVLAEQLGAGRTVVGRKIGLTSPAVQAQLGVDRPDFGVLLDDMAVADGDTVDTAALMQPKVEAEIAFVLSRDLTQGPFDAASVRDAVDYAVAALEIVDSRISNWDITFGDTVADNGSSARFVLGGQRRTLDDFAPVDVEMQMSVDDEVVSTGNGAACLGDPLAALAWLATTAADNGDPLRAGQVVLSGALGPMHAVSSGARVEARITGFEPVTVTFSPTSSSSSTSKERP